MDNYHQASMEQGQMKGHQRRKLCLSVGLTLRRWHSQKHWHSQTHWGLRKH
jgi:hypothetical protein